MLTKTNYYFDYKDYICRRAKGIIKKSPRIKKMFCKESSY